LSLNQLLQRISSTDRRHFLDSGTASSCTFEACQRALNLVKAAQHARKFSQAISLQTHWQLSRAAKELQRLPLAR
jgi:hypothetical protein